MAEARGALITGGASGIGRATAERLLAAGWSVVVADYNAASGKAVLDAWAARYKDRADFIRADVSREADVEAAVRRVSERFGRLDFVFNNAGVGGAFGPVTDLEVDDWDYTFAVLVRGVFLGTKHAARVMQRQGTGGAIVNTGSIAGLAGGAGPQAYSAAKAAVIHFTRMIAAELAPHRIRVNSISPGVIHTPLVDTGKRDVRAAIEGIQPWTDLGQPDDIARVVEFLAGDGARFVTGENVVIDGGLMAAGVRLADRLGGDPGRRGKAGVNRGTTGEAHAVRRVDLPPPAGAPPPRTSA
ncbi:MAG TPA: SDR family NAD(P)-dependent oxidoreductase [Candidatus Binatia bacterium]|nr:SDR family NAD(P)-dependent oxidoreductase [Candidatus Binatia bacterium]